MIIPDHWAQARLQHKNGRKTVTVRRHGWSNSSEAEAQLMAQQRASDALARILAGERLDRLERKVAYNGAEGTPIREEVISRHGDAVITRNGYGARCLNTARALFADVDFDKAPTFRQGLWMFAALTACFVALGLVQKSWLLGIAGLVIALVAAWPLTRLLLSVRLQLGGGAPKLARERIEKFLAANPAWGLRLYQTPAGFRVLATHRQFEAQSQEVRRFFEAIKADPVYVRMCVHQNCFRARLSAKPWRMGIDAHMRPRPGVWPVNPELAPLRQQWVQAYEAKASLFAACRFVESLGSGSVHDSLRDVIELHDRESGALKPGLKLA